ncbi:MAG: hypothetical protein ACK4NW_02845 [Roseinatronobacter sp.]
MEKQTIIRGAAILVAGITASTFSAQYLLEGRSATQVSQSVPTSETPQVVSAGFMASRSTPEVTTGDEAALDDASFLALSNAADTVEAQAAPVDFAPMLAATETRGEASSADALDCTPRLMAQDTIDALIELSVTAPCHTNERLVISHADLAFSAFTNGAGTFSAFLPALNETAKIDVFLGDDVFLQAEVAVPDVHAHYRVVLQWTGDAGFGLHAYHGEAGFGSEGHLHALKPFDASLDEAFLISLGERHGPEPMLAEVYSIPAGLAEISRIELELQFQAQECGQEVSAFVLQTGAGIVTDVKEASFATPPCPAEDGFVLMPLPMLEPRHAQLQTAPGAFLLDLSE